MMKTVKKEPYGIIYLKGLNNSCSPKGLRKYIKRFSNEILIFNCERIDEKYSDVKIVVSSLESLILILYIDYHHICETIQIEYEIKLSKGSEELTLSSNITWATLRSLNPLKFYRRRIKGIILLQNNLPPAVRQVVLRYGKVIRVEGLNSDFPLVNLVNLIEQNVAEILFLKRFSCQNDQNKMKVLINMSETEHTQKIISMMEVRKHKIFREVKGEVIFSNPGFQIDAFSLLMPIFTKLSE